MSPTSDYSQLRSGAAGPAETSSDDGATAPEDRHPTAVEQHGAHHDFGDKTITFWGSCVLNFNNITGPAVIVLPLLFQQSGWLLPTLGLLVMWLVSSFAATMLTESMQRIPGNANFQHRYEYCSLVQHYFGRRWYLLAQIGFNAGLTASNILSMVITSQVLDTVFSKIVGTTYGVSYASWPPELLTSAPGSSSDAHGCNWGIVGSANGPPPSVTCNSSVISVGYLLAMAVCVPMAYLNLDENMGFQWASMWAQLLCSFQFAYEFLLRTIPGTDAYCAGTGPSHTPLIGLDTSQVVGVCVFAFSYVSTIPSWANEKRPGVSVNKAVWLPSSVGVCLNILLGLLGAWAYSLLDFSQPGGRPQPYTGTDDILNLLDGQADPRVFTCAVPAGQEQQPYTVSWLTELCVYIWGIGGYVPGIPILAIMVRYNLQSSGVVGHWGAFFWAVVAPWIFTAFFYQAQALLQFCSWVALLCQGFINLIVPILLYRQALLQYPTQAELEAKKDRLAEGTTWNLPCSVLSSSSCALHAGFCNFNPRCLLSLWLPSAKSSLTESLIDHTHSPSGGRGVDPSVYFPPQILQGMDDKVDHTLVLPLSSQPSSDEASKASEEVHQAGEETSLDTVEAVPSWLRMDPLFLANSMTLFVTVAVVASTVLSFVS